MVISKLATITSANFFARTTRFQLVAWLVVALIALGITRLRLALQSPALFRAVQADPGGYGISWNDELDLSEAELWRHGVSPTAEHSLSHERSETKPAKR